MVNINNEECITDLSINQFEQDAQKVLTLMGYGDFDLGILLTDNQAIQCFNRDFRSKDEPTDILSFPFHPDLQPGESIIIETEDDKNVGDLIISLEYIKGLCEQENKTINEHLRTLLCHGICHLLGYDHYTESSDKIMQEKENWLTAKLIEK
ncbi:MAG TPA: rRNA maturation RNase YbeY [Candidatus Babeliales bacterium]|nr:rRNA maturation RNase YbeY [Candidatus Babeliales bacterium]